MKDHVLESDMEQLELVNFDGDEDE